MNDLRANSTAGLLVLACLAMAAGTVRAESGQNVGAARNVILFIGDGMGVSTVTATRIFVGQQAGGPGEDHQLSFERFPHLALVKTYNTNQQVPDSAGTATAMHTGVKTRAGVIGVGPAAARGDCDGGLANRLTTLGEKAVAAGLAIGIVSTTRITHATPAAVFAHVPERNWENDGAIPASQRARGCRDVAEQLIEFPFDTALGGGAANFYGHKRGGRRAAAEADLVQQWTASTGGSFAVNRKEMFEADPEQPLLGLFHASHMSYMLDREADSPEPTLSEMTRAALERLGRSEKGYYLMVEGGRIDHGHHEGRAGYALTETAEFARAVAVADEMTSAEDTLILVTADHSHVFTIAGYPTRGNPILGLVHGNDERGEALSKPTLAADGKPYSTLGYWNGPGAIAGVRAMPNIGFKAVQQAAVPTLYGKRPFETHGGEDVALYARGPGSAAVHGVMEQNRIFDIIVGAFGWTVKEQR